MPIPNIFHIIRYALYFVSHTYCDCQLHDVCLPLNWFSPETPPSLLYSACAVLSFSRSFTIGVTDAAAPPPTGEEKIGRMRERRTGRVFSLLTSHSRLVLLASAHACVRTHLQPPFSHSVRSRDTVAGWSRWLLRSFLLEMDASVGRAGKRRKSRTDGRNCRRVTATDVADDKQCHACLYKISSNELPTPLPSFISTLTNACRSSSWASKGKIKGKISPFA